MSEEEVEYAIDRIVRLSETGDESEIRDALSDSISLLRKLHDERTDGRLAKSVLDFAEWQNTGYSQSTETKISIGRRLWLEVAENVHRITKTMPPSPRFN